MLKGNCDLWHRVQKECSISPQHLPANNTGNRTHPAELASLQRNQDANSGHLCSAYPAVAKVGDVENIVNSQDTRSCGAILPCRLSEETTGRLPRRKTVEKLLTVPGDSHSDTEQPASLQEITPADSQGKSQNQTPELPGLKLSYHPFAFPSLPFLSMLFLPTSVPPLPQQ